jgi:hypothetical protein
MREVLARAAGSVRECDCCVCEREIEGRYRRPENTPSDWSEVAFLMAFRLRHSSLRDKWTSTVQSHV